MELPRVSSQNLQIREVLKSGTCVTECHFRLLSVFALLTVGFPDPDTLIKVSHWNIHLYVE